MQSQADFVKHMVKNPEAFTFFIGVLYSVFAITEFRPSDLASCFANDNWLQNEALYVANKDGRPVSPRRRHRYRGLLRLQLL